MLQVVAEEQAQCRYTLVKSAALIVVVLLKGRQGKGFKRNDLG